MTDLFKTEDLTPIDPEKDYFPELVGEGKKYADTKAAGRAIVEKDRFIEQLKREQAALRSDLAQRAKMEEMLAKIEEKTSQPPPQQQNNQPVQPDQAKPTIDEKTILELMNRRDRERAAEANEATVANRLRQVYGDNYAAVVKHEASKMGIGTEFLSDLARRQPQAFFKLLGLDEVKQRPDVVTPPSNTFKPTGNASPEKTYSYYENIRKTKPSEYWKPAVQNEMMKQLENLGQEEFYK